MNWYYVEQGQQAGPLSDEQFDEMVRAGKIQPDTLVWREGMAGWMPCRDVKAGAAVSGATAAATSASEAVCVECGKIFPIDETISYGGSRVCANCKPVFLQKLKEGAVISTGGLNYARVLTRFGAVFLDGLLLGAVNMMFGMLLGVFGTTSAQKNPGAFIVVQFVLIAIELAIGVTYEGVMVGKYGATLGKMAFKIKVVTADGGRVSYGRAFGRYFAKMLSSLTCLIGYIIAIFDNPQKRALHDHICNTRVIYR
jgi:uncharacterized RDD family membrane protein YckC